ncbi:hypothetical protein D3C81_1321970 [compost metagenome]
MRIVISPITYAEATVITRPTSSPNHGDNPNCVVRYAVLYAPSPTNAACPNDVMPPTPVSSTSPIATMPYSPM